MNKITLNGILAIEALKNLPEEIVDVLSEISNETKPSRVIQDVNSRKEAKHNYAKEQKLKRYN